MGESRRDDIAKLEMLYSEHPEGRIFTHLAEAYRRAGNLERAREVLEDGLPRHSSYASAHVVHGRVLLDEGRSEAAAAAFQRVLELDPYNMVALRAIGDIALAAGRMDDAGSAYRRLLVVDPANEEARAALATVEAGSPGPDPEAGSADAGGAMDLGWEQDEPGGREVSSMEGFEATEMSDADDSEREAADATAGGATPDWDLPDIELGDVTDDSSDEEWIPSLEFDTDDGLAGDYQDSALADLPDWEIRAAPGDEDVDPQGWEPEDDKYAPETADEGIESGQEAWNPEQDDTPEAADTGFEMEHEAWQPEHDLDAESEPGPYDAAAEGSDSDAGFGASDDWASKPDARADPLDQDAAESEVVDPLADVGAEFMEGELVTETIADLYAQQGLHDRAREMYNQLLTERPGDQRIESKLAMLEAAGDAPRGTEEESVPGAATEEAADRPGADELQGASGVAAEPGDAGEAGGERREEGAGMEAGASDDDEEDVAAIESFWTGGEGADGGDVSPYAWGVHTGEDTGETEEVPTGGEVAGPPIGEYFNRLLQWRPTDAGRDADGSGPGDGQGERDGDEPPDELESFDGWVENVEP